MCNGCSNSGSATKVKKTKGNDQKHSEKVTMTKEAADYILDLLEKEDKKSWGFKVDVIPGGCAGYKYFMAFQEKAEDNELTSNFHGVNLYLSPDSAELLGGSTIEYTATLEASGLRVNNPNATTTCGCGKSFG